MKFKRKKRHMKRLEKLANSRLRNLRFSYEVAEDILKEGCLRYYNGTDVEILDAKKLRLNRVGGL